MGSINVNSSVRVFFTFAPYLSLPVPYLLFETDGWGQSTLFEGLRAIGIFGFTPQKNMGLFGGLRRLTFCLLFNPNVQPSPPPKVTSQKHTNSLFIFTCQDAEVLWVCDGLKLWHLSRCLIWNGIEEVCTLAVRFLDITPRGIIVIGS
ncbi:hypothetical protein DdX_15150 [Ditylenchus destructor]|uniref:Uncharacterized protein n=1 Tax=Ditylenchus destructor TaxID=166010 RepID=A0AAD4R190_9BILA|nr:hypothetical protein DdX_15150 [Ditylenchus destructor]